MPATLTPLRYPGGKTKYAKLFAEVIRRNGLTSCKFIEVFAGGAGSAISLLLKGHVGSLVLNDLDVSIYSFWKAVKEYPEELVDLIEKTPISIQEWKNQKRIYEAKDTKEELLLGFATFYLNRSNHSGILHARPVGGMSQNGRYRIDSRFTKSTSIEKIRRIASFADKIEVCNLDGNNLIDLLVSKYKAEKTLIYFDPPYYQKGPALYLNHFCHGDHERLRDSILACPLPWLLSYDRCSEIVDLYKDQGCKIYVNSLRHTIAGNSEAEELIVSPLNVPEYLVELE